MTIRKKTKKIFEVAHDLETDTHTLAAEGAHGISSEELEKMEDTVLAGRAKRRAGAEKIRDAAAAEQRRLVNLDAKRKPWKTQKDKYNNGAIGSDEDIIQNPTPDSGNKKDKEAGCTTCAAKGLKRLILGSAKLLKAELGIDAASAEVFETRKNICLSCDEYDFGVCNACGCFTSAKCKLSSEKCPKEKW
jgi:hypothetical protein